ncbi:unnamed protein product [Diabrotica balteata]|uniref:Uncharacterized protein n=1 Tax=Diabrotica balteata TaxID=107213 RepID=A0A9N9X8P4_DIABA|nr:unnamed protein product [Diabrotica balteata]
MYFKSYQKYKYYNKMDCVNVCENESQEYLYQKTLIRRFQNENSYLIVGLHRKNLILLMYVCYLPFWSSFTPI